MQASCCNYSIPALTSRLSSFSRCQTNFCAARRCPLPQRCSISSWDAKSYEIVAGGGTTAYLDEQDVATFLDRSGDLIPLDPRSYNPAAYLWKKIEDIPEERRHLLLHLLSPRLILRAWEIAGMRYEDSKLLKKIAPTVEGDVSLQTYDCRKSGGPFPVSLLSFFKKAIFHCSNGKTYGRFFGGNNLDNLVKFISPLYFEVTQVRKVMSTESPCDLAYELGDGLFDLHGYPEGFPGPAKHQYPFNDQVVVYIRHIGPGVLVGQAWQEGATLEHVPRKLCGDILMVREYAVCSSSM